MGEKKQNQMLMISAKNLKLRKKINQHVIIVKSLHKEIRLDDINPVKVAGWIKKSLEDIVRVRRLKNGDLLVGCENEEQAEKLLKTKMLGKIEIFCQLLKY